MKKSKKMFVIVMAFVLVFAFTTTAFAATWVASQEWLGSKCLNSFITSGYVQKGVGTWDFVNIGIYGYNFATPPANDYLAADPRNSAGTKIGDEIHIPNYSELATSIWSNGVYGPRVYLKIMNPNPGNNMYSHGFWEGYID